LNLLIRVSSAIALAGGCSAHSLDYLQQGDHANAAAGNAGITAVGGLAEMEHPKPAGASAGGAAGSDAPAPRCQDGQTNGEEADIDCGGRVCGPCDAGSRCQSGNDCASAICTNEICQPASCTDLARNGDETDVNCGGSCPPCSIGHGCQLGGDCESASCTGSLCSVPNCDGAVPGAGCPLLIDNTAYSLRPVHAPTSCIDAAARGVDAGVEMQQYRCNDGVNQSFWALAAPGGYFALRNALSGKCMQVRANSLEGDAQIEQATCTGRSEQLFLPTADGAGVKLSVQSSGLSLDVSGANSVTNGQRIVQSVDDGSPDMRWNIQPAGRSAFLTLRAVVETNSVLRHVEAQVLAQPSTGGDSAWKVEPGLAKADCVSFQSSDQPGAYIRHEKELLWSEISDGSLLFSRDATFCFRPALSGTDRAFRSLESFNSPGDFVNASDGRVRLLTLQETPEFRELATWLMDSHK
jgi:hypothetical protein